MPTKVTPIAPKGGGGGAGAAAKPSTTRPNAAASKLNPGGKPAGHRGSQHFFDSQRFTVATARISEATREFSEITRAGCRGSASSLAFVGVVGSVMIGLGIFLVHYGDDKFIIDLMVIGSLCIVAGTFSLLFGFTAILRPIYVQRKEDKARERAQRLAIFEGPISGGSVRRAPLPSTSSAGAAGMPNTYSVIPMIFEDEEAVTQPAARTSAAAPASKTSAAAPAAKTSAVTSAAKTSAAASAAKTSAAAPGEDLLYLGTNQGESSHERRPSVAEQAAGEVVTAASKKGKGTIDLPPPPLLFQPLDGKEGTSSTVITTNFHGDADSASDVDNVSEVDSGRGLEDDDEGGVWRKAPAHYDLDDSVGVSPRQPADW